MSTQLRHGVFLAPYHALEEDPAMCIKRDLDLIQLADSLGFEEAWVGEHHSAGFETIDCPDLIIAASAHRTSRIRLGTGVLSLPYHNPLMVANRVVQLDYMTHGRFMFGAGPGLLISDALMLGIDPDKQRDRMAESLDVILRLLRGETVTETTDWYQLKDAKVHLRPYTEPHPEVVVASAVSPSGGRLAGEYDLGMLCVAATASQGFDALATNWKIACDGAQRKGRKMDPRRLRLVAPIHIAETREKARENVKFGLQKYVDYFNVLAPNRVPVPSGVDPVDFFNDTQLGVIGTPDDVIAMIERLQAKQGDFGVFLQQVHDWADWQATDKSFELYARYVVPHFTNRNQNRRASYNWSKQNSASLGAQRQQAVDRMFEKHAQETGQTGDAGSKQELKQKAW